MELENIAKKVDDLTKEVYELKGQVTSLTAIVGIYQTQSSKLEGRQWSALLMGFGGLAGAILNFLMGKH